MNRYTFITRHGVSMVEIADTLPDALKFLKERGHTEEQFQAVHIHKGTCAKLDPKPAYPLSPVKNGKSETTVNASLDSLQKGEYAINGHKSAQDVASYVFCGDIGKM